MGATAARNGHATCRTFRGTQRGVGTVEVAPSLSGDTITAPRVECSAFVRGACAVGKAHGHNRDAAPWAPSDVGSVDAVASRTLGGAAKAGGRTGARGQCLWKRRELTVTIRPRSSAYDTCMRPSRCALFSVHDTQALSWSLRCHRATWAAGPHSFQGASRAGGGRPPWSPQ